MIANNINGTISVFNSIPKVFELKKNTMNYNKLNPSVHYADGFRELVNPILEVNQYNRENSNLHSYIYLIIIFLKSFQEDYN